MGTARQRDVGARIHQNLRASRVWQSEEPARQRGQFARGQVLLANLNQLDTLGQPPRRDFQQRFDPASRMPVGNVVAERFRAADSRTPRRRRGKGSGLPAPLHAGS